VLFQHADAGEIAGIVGMCRWNDAGEADRHGLMQGEPPITLIEFRNWSAIKECKPMKVCQRIRGFVVLPVTSRILYIGQTFKISAAFALSADTAW